MRRHGSSPHLAPYQRFVIPVISALQVVCYLFVPVAPGADCDILIFIAQRLVAYPSFISSLIQLLQAQSQKNIRFR